ncbi:T-cell surface antigen CD2 [Dissostichus eleginoides]|uniref:T-cell surface antigen CD2 n=1 Tax=Dissostichus eleginoides TaxID=100907 RepID=A0AAD9CGM4_DISEL|nr:T-cell surface antigen CD2 [Dissostichus eleginoides]
MFTLTETESGFNVSISNVSPQHAGVYWCGVESTEGSYRAALRKIQLEMEDGPEIVIPVIICVAALMLLLFVIILILIYKRYSKNKRNAAAEQHDTQDYIYEEIQERPQKPDSGNSSTTFYSTANFPRNPSTSQHYSTINFRNGSGEAAEVLMTNPSSSACDYSAVKDGEIPTCSNVNQPSPVDPLYSTVNKTQQQ